MKKLLLALVIFNFSNVNSTGKDEKEINLTDNLIINNRSTVKDLHLKLFNDNKELKTEILIGKEQEFKINKEVLSNLTMDGEVYFYYIMSSELIGTTFEVKYLLPKKEVFAKFSENNGVPSFNIEMASEYIDFKN